MFRWIEHFVSEPAMDIRGLGEALVRALLEHGLIRDPADLYALTMEGLLELPGIKEKSATNLLRSIDRSRQRSLSNVVFALGIRYVGFQTAELLAHAFGDLDALQDASEEALEGVEGIGHKTAESVAEWMTDMVNRGILQRLKEAGVTWREARGGDEGAPLSGRTFLITGRLESLTRGQAESRLKALGATIAPGMSKSVDFLIAGTDPGSKLEKARKLDTPIKDEDWLTAVLTTQTLPEAP
jgi:DNA ligase (NAD+)